MPWSSNEQLPKEVRSALPPAAQTIWRKAYNSAVQRGENSEENAAKVAWNAVKNVFRKSGETWVRKAEEIYCPTCVMGVVPDGNKCPVCHVTLIHKAEATTADVRELVKVANIPNWLRSRLLDALSTSQPAEKKLSKAQQAEYDAETEKIRENKQKTENQEPHKFTPAQWTFGNGHPRCLKCGGEQSTDDICRPETEKEIDPQDLLAPENPDNEYTIVAKAEEHRFTYGPVYAPELVDAHGEMMTAEDLQKTLWGYVEKNDRTIRLQHSNQRAGEWLEITAWPFEVTLPLTKADGTSKSTVFPAGTVFMGVRWDANVWPAVKAGKIGGYSFGGRATKITTYRP